MYGCLKISMQHTCQAQPHEDAGMGVLRDAGLVVQDPGARDGGGALGDAQPCSTAQRVAGSACTATSCMCARGLQHSTAGRRVCMRCSLMNVCSQAARRCAGYRRCLHCLKVLAFTSLKMATHRHGLQRSR